jgi:hypothetical protein
LAKEMSTSREMRPHNGQGGHLYMRTNETENHVIHYHRDASGGPTEVTRIPTGSAGSGGFKPISAPNAKRSMVLNSATPLIEINAETYEVRAGGRLLTCEPTKVPPMAQQYFLY